MASYEVGGGPRRIVCLTEEFVEILYRIGEQDRIVGISAYAVRPPEARAEKPVVSAFTGGSIEKIRALEPDLVLGFSDVQADFARQLISNGLPVFICNQRSIQQILDVILDVGSLVGRRDAARGLIDQCIIHLEGVQRRVASRGWRPRVYFEEWDDPQICGIRWVSELIGIAGGIDVFEEKSWSAASKGRTVTREELAESNPDVMLASWCGKKFDRASVIVRPGLSSIPAVHHGRIHEIPSEIILQPGPASLLDGVTMIEELLGNCTSESNEMV